MLVHLYLLSALWTYSQQITHLLPLVPKHTTNTLLPQTRSYSNQARTLWHPGASLSKQLGMQFMWSLKTVTTRLSLYCSWFACVQHTDTLATPRNSTVKIKSHHHFKWQSQELTCSRHSGGENLSPQADECHLLQSLSFLSLQKPRLVTLKIQSNWTGCLHVSDV